MTKDSSASHVSEAPRRVSESVERVTLSVLSESIIRKLPGEELLGQLCSTLVERGRVAGAWVSCTLPDGSLALGSGHPAHLTGLVERQFTLREGPCVECLSTAEPVFEDRLPERAGRRWPAWARDASELLTGEVTTLRSDPIATGARSLGALCVVGSPQAVRSASSPDIRRVVQVAATHALTVRSLGEAQELADQLQQALRTRVRIEQAKGALARHYGIAVDAAFERLRWLARDQGLRLHEVAEAVLEQLEGSGRATAPSTLDGRGRVTPPLRIIGVPRGLRLVGAADISAVPLLAAALEQLDLGQDALVDLGELAFLDAQCASTLLQCGRQRHAHGTRLTLAGARPLVRQVLELLGAASAPGIDLVELVG